MCARARPRAVAVAAVYSSMADCSKYTVEEAGFDISALKTSLIQYFRCRNRASDHCSLPPRVIELRHNRTPLIPGIHRKWTQTAALGFREKINPAEVREWSLSGVKTTLCFLLDCSHRLLRPWTTLNYRLARKSTKILQLLLSLGFFYRTRIVPTHRWVAFCWTLTEVVVWTFKRRFLQL